MKTLVLVRHALAVAKETERPDVERPLVPEGEKQAAGMAKKLKNAGLEAGFMISSPADRALETALLFAKQFRYPAQKILLVGAIYKSPDGKDFLGLVRDIDDRYQTVWVFGHNPSLTEFAKRLVKDIRLDIPKAGGARIEFAVPTWKAVSPENARLAGLDIPGAAVEELKWKKKIRKELTAKLLERDLALLDGIDKAAAAELEKFLRSSLKKVAVRFVKEARNFSFPDLSWFPEPGKPAKPRAGKVPKKRRQTPGKKATGKPRWPRAQTVSEAAIAKPQPEKGESAAE